MSWMHFCDHGKCGAYSAMVVAALPGGTKIRDAAGKHTGVVVIDAESRTAFRRLDAAGKQWAAAPTLTFCGHHYHHLELDLLTAGFILVFDGRKIPIAAEGKKTSERQARQDRKGSS